MKQLEKIRRGLKSKLILPILNESLFDLSLSYSQAGQDFWVYTDCFNQSENGFFLDIGAHNGIYLSNTLILERRFKWKGICIEANPETFRKLSENRSAKCVNFCVDTSKGKVNFLLNDVYGGIIASDCDNLNDGSGPSVQVDALPLVEILRMNDAPKVIDYMSIDIEGAEDRALLEFDFANYKFKCITIERPSNQLRKVLAENNYILIKEIPELDCFYIHDSFKLEYRENYLDFWRGRHSLITLGR